MSECQNLSDPEDRKNWIKENGDCDEMHAFFAPNIKPNNKVKKPKPMTFNMDFSNSDLTLVDIIAAKQSCSRNAVLSKFIELELTETYYSLDRESQCDISLHVDEQLSESGVEHDYQEMTWLVAHLCFYREHLVEPSWIREGSPWKKAFEEVNKK
jgi:hypothetical protein